MELADTIDFVKTKIKELKGIPIDNQLIIYSGKKLTNENRLSDYNISKETPYVTLRIISSENKASGV